MKKILILFITILASLSIFIGINAFQSYSSNTTKKITPVKENEDKKINLEKLSIEERYNKVNKKYIQYKNCNDTTDVNYFETDNGFVGTPVDLPHYDDKIYCSTLNEFSFFAEVNPTFMTFDKAISLAKKILPDDIKEERRKFDDYTGSTSIVYSSSQGNFVLLLEHQISYDNVQDDDLIKVNNSNYVRQSVIVGISYLMELK